MNKANLIRIRCQNQYRYRVNFFPDQQFSVILVLVSQFRSGLWIRFWIWVWSNSRFLQSGMIGVRSDQICSAREMGTELIELWSELDLDLLTRLSRVDQNRTMRIGFWWIQICGRLLRRLGRVAAVKMMNDWRMVRGVVASGSGSKLSQAWLTMRGKPRLGWAS